MKISPGIIAHLHHTDRKQMVLLKEQCAEKRKAPLLYCYNRSKDFQDAESVHNDQCLSHFIQCWWMCLIRPSAIGKINSPSLGNITSFALSLFEWISAASIVSNSSRSAISTSPFQIPPRVKSVSEEQSK